MSTLASNSEQNKYANGLKQLVLRSLQLYYIFIVLFWTIFRPVELMTPLYNGDTQSFKLSDVSLV